MLPITTPPGSLATLYVGLDQGKAALAVCSQPLAKEPDCAYVPMPSAAARIGFNWRRGTGLTLGLATLVVDGRIQWQTSMTAMTDEITTATGVQLGLLSNQIVGSGVLRFDGVSIKTCTP